MSKIGHAAKDENARYSGGKAGDQTNGEVYTRSWYSRPWTHVLWPTDPAVGEKLAQAMERACRNDKIGYDQNQRNSLLTQVRSRGFDPAQATTPCECDCSSLVCVCAMFAGVPESTLYRDGNCATTSNLRSRLMSTGLFDLYAGERYLSSPDYIPRGAILLSEGRHVAINLEDGKFVASVARVLKIGSVGERVKRLQRALNEQSGAMLTVDGEYGPLTAAAVRCFQATHGLAVDGECGPKTEAALNVAIF